MTEALTGRCFFPVIPVYLNQHTSSVSVLTAGKSTALSLASQDTLMVLFSHLFSAESFTFLLSVTGSYK